VTDPIRILLVAEDERDRLAVRQTLASIDEPTELRDAGSAAAARSILEAWQPDCLLLDAMLEGDEPASVLRILREIAVDVPVIVLASDESEPAAEELIGSGALDLLPKSALSPVRLAQRVKQAIRVNAADRRERETQALLARQAEQLSLLAGACLRVHGELSIEGALGVAVREASKLFPHAAIAARCEVTAGGDIVSSAAPPLLAEILETVPFSSTPLSWVRGESIEGGPASALAATSVDGRSIEGGLSAPLFSRRGVQGDLQVFSFAAGWPRFDLNVLVELASTVSVALENARLYADAQAATRARDDVLAIVSHDLRNPLNNVALSASLLGEHLEDRKDAARELALVHRISRGVERMHRLIADLLDAASIDTGTLTLTRRDERGALLVDEALDAVQSMADAKHCTLVRGSVDGELRVYADRERIHQVLVNLLTNAIRFAKSRVVLSLEAHGDRATFSVIDDGPGIEAAHLPLLFQRFWKAPGGGRDGAGLGLYIARGIVVAHEGALDLLPLAAGGTAARFWLPRSLRETAPTQS
jgi:signal transduction histidine kinase/CheY-like chemotaxis protein